MAEVDVFQGQLVSIDQENTKLRDQYMQLEDEACKLIDHYKEAIDSEADFLRREPTAMDQCARRCQVRRNFIRKIWLIRRIFILEKKLADRTNSF